MIELLAAEGAALINPEAIINAAIAAKAAESAAWSASIMAAITMVVLLIIGALMFCIVYEFLELKRCFVGMREKFEKLERNTDGILTSLIESTRKLALIEGNIIGRAELAAEGTKNIAAKTTVTSSETINTVTSEVKK